MIGGSLDYVDKYDKRWEDDSADESSTSSSGADDDTNSVVALDEEAQRRQRANQRELVVIRRTRCMALTALCSIAFIMGHIIFYQIKVSETNNFDKAVRIHLTTCVG